MSTFQAALLLAGGIAVGILAVSIATTDPAGATTGGYAITADAQLGAVWRVNTDTGSVWFCTAAKSPKCLLAKEAND